MITRVVTVTDDDGLILGRYTVTSNEPFLTTYSALEAAAEMALDDSDDGDDDH